MNTLTLSIKGVVIKKNDKSVSLAIHDKNLIYEKKKKTANVEI